MSAAFLYDAVRTPFGRYGGGLAAIRPDDLAAHVVRALLERSPELDPARIDDVCFGDANGAGEDNRDVARMAVLLAGLPTSVPGTTVNRLCGSSLDASMQAARAVEVGDLSLTLVGGVESMSRAPWVLLKPIAGFRPRTPSCIPRRSAGGSSTRGCPSGGRSRSARAPRSWRASTGSRERRRTSSRASRWRGSRAAGCTPSTRTCSGSARSRPPSARWLARGSGGTTSRRSSSTRRSRPSRWHACANGKDSIPGSLAHELRRRGGGYGLAAICIGVGQGLAVVLEA